MNIGRLGIYRPHLARHWWSGFRIEWSYTHKGDIAPNMRCHFISVEIQ